MRAIFLLMFLLAGHAAPAGLRVIHDAGGTRPLLPLARASGLLPEKDAVESSSGMAAPAPPDPYAVVSPSLTPGAQPRLPTGDAGRYLPRPLFLVGADSLSLHWLRQHRARLEALGAVGLVVSAAGRADYARLRAAANGLPLAAGSGETLAAQFGLRHYPVLIGPEWIEQ